MAEVICDFDILLHAFDSTSNVKVFADVDESRYDGKDEGCQQTPVGILPFTEVDCSKYH